MKQETILILILLVSGIISLATKIYYETNNRKNKKIKLIKDIFISLFIISVLFLQGFLNGIGKTEFNLKSEQNYWLEKDLPQLDPDMYLNQISQQEIIFYSNSKKDIYHHSKIIEFDLFDIYSITDCIKYLNENKTLQIEFTKSTFYRDEKIKYSLDNIDISKNEFDKYIEKWKLSDKIYSISD